MTIPEDRKLTNDVLKAFHEAIPVKDPNSCEHPGLVCLRVTAFDPRNASAGTKATHDCAFCGERVVTSPSARLTLAGAPHMVVICLQCAEKAGMDPFDKEQFTTPELKEDLRRFLDADPDRN